MEAEEESRIALRLPAELHRALIEIAKTERRSVNAQIVYLLERAIKPSAAEADRPE